MNRKQELKEQLKEIAHTHQTLQHEYDELCVLDKFGSIQDLVWRHDKLVEQFHQLTSSKAALTHEVGGLELDVLWYKRLCVAWETLTCVLLIIVVVMA